MTQKRHKPGIPSIEELKKKPIDKLTPTEMDRLCEHGQKEWEKTEEKTNQIGIECA